VKLYVLYTFVPNAVERAQDGIPEGHEVVAVLNKKPSSRTYPTDNYVATVAGSEVTLLMGIPEPEAKPEISKAKTPDTDPAYSAYLDVVDQVRPVFEAAVRGEDYVPEDPMAKSAEIADVDARYRDFMEYATDNKVPRAKALKLWHLATGMCAPVLRLFDNLPTGDLN
jgi:hypothetical protein